MHFDVHTFTNFKLLRLIINHYNYLPMFIEIINEPIFFHVVNVKYFERCILIACQKIN